MGIIKCPVHVMQHLRLGTASTPYGGAGPSGEGRQTLSGEKVQTCNRHGRWSAREENREQAEGPIRL